MKYELKEGDIVRCWDDSSTRYYIRTYAGDGLVFSCTYKATLSWDNIEPAHPSEYCALNKYPTFPVKTRDMSHIQQKPEEKDMPRKTVLQYMVRNQSTSHTHQKHPTYEAAVAEANRLCTTSKSFDKFEVLQVVAVVSPSVTPNVEEF